MLEKESQPGKTVATLSTERILRVLKNAAANMTTNAGRLRIPYRHYGQLRKTIARLGRATTKKIISPTSFKAQLPTAFRTGSSVNNTGSSMEYSFVSLSKGEDSAREFYKKYKSDYPETSV